MPLRPGPARQAAEHQGLDRSFQLDEFLLLPPDFDEFLSSTTESALEQLGVRRTRQTLEGTSLALSILLANLLKASAISNEHEGWVSVSLNQNTYVNTRYNNRSLGFRGLKRAFDFLTHQENRSPVEVVDGFLDRERGIGRQTRIRLSQPFYLSFFRSPFRPDPFPYPFNPPPTITNSTSWFPVSLLVSDLSAEVIRLKDENKNLIPYDDDAETGRMRDRLLEWNHFALGQWPDLFIPDRELLGIPADAEDAALADVMERAGEALPSRLDLSKRCLYRVFNDGSFERGGRLYGGWWQHVPSEIRKYIVINGHITQEIDFSNMQAAMLYAREGLALPEDAYSLPGVDPIYRKLIKRTFFQLINARPDQQIRAPGADQLPPGMAFDDLQRALAEKHEPIAHYLRSGIGIELQRIDAEIALSIMTAAMDRDELVLPIHDSFIARRQFAEHELREIMAHAYRQRMGAEIGMDLDPGFADWLFDNMDPERYELFLSGAFGYEHPVYEDLEAMIDAGGYEGYRERLAAFARRQPEWWLNRYHGSPVGF